MERKGKVMSKLTEKLMALLLTVVLTVTLVPSLTVFAEDTEEQIQVASSIQKTEATDSSDWRSEVQLALNSEGSGEGTISRDSESSLSIGICGANATWLLDDNGVLTINGTGKLYDFEYTDDCWLSQAESIKEVVVEEGITYLGDFAFYNCENMTKVTLPSTVKKIGEGAFWYSGIEELTIPDSVTSVGQLVFGECPNLTTVKFGTGLKSTSEFMFAGCQNLVSVNLGTKVQTLAEYTFVDCYSLEKLTIPKSVTLIEDYAIPYYVELTIKNSNLQPFGYDGYKCAEPVKISGKRDYAAAYKVLELVNKQRTKKGLSKLKMDKSLLETAMLRSAETAVCFSHTRPNGSTCFSANDLMMAENIAAGQTSATEVMTSWMNSSGHKANILDSSSTSIGIGCFIHNGVYYWVQCFGQNSPSSFTKPSNKTVKSKVYLSMEGFNDVGTVSSGSSYDYTYKPYISLNSTKIKAGKTTKASFVLPNVGFSYFEAIIVPESVKWSSDSKKATVSSSGVVKGYASGTPKITGKLTYYKASKKVTVTGSITATVSKGKYKVTGSSTAAYVSPSSASATSAKVLSKVKISGRIYKVTYINSSAFKNTKKLKTVTLGTNITSIGTKAFYNCKSLTTIKVPKSRLEKYTEMIQKSGVRSSVKIKSL